MIFLGTGIFFTVKCRFFQFLGLLFWWSQTAGRLLGVRPPDSNPENQLPGRPPDGREASPAGSSKNRHTVSQLQSVCTALAATVGTGNIAGVATALTAGGPGALFWMWLSAFIGMITAYAETVLGIRYRRKNPDGSYTCGPYVYMEYGLKAKGMGMFYSFLCLMCALGMGSMVQANAASAALEHTWGVPALAGGVLLTCLLVLVIWGGVSRIGLVAGRLVPVASAVYILFSLVVILSCLDRIPSVLEAVFHSAFRMEAAAGGAAGSLISRSMRYGMSRGVFSNEAGLGTLAVLHGPAEGTTPHEQGMWAMFEVFFDTIVLCTLTALVILCMAGPSLDGAPCDGAPLAVWAFKGRLGGAGEYLVSGSMAVFAFATMMAWFYLGKEAAAWLFQGTGTGGLWFSSYIYPVLFLAAVLAGSGAGTGTVWLLSDLWNGLMAFPNLTALLFLAGEVTLPPGFLKKE